MYPGFNNGKEEERNLPVHQSCACIDHTSHGSYPLVADTEQRCHEVRRCWESGESYAGHWGWNENASWVDAATPAVAADADAADATDGYGTARDATETDGDPEHRN